MHEYCVLALCSCHKPCEKEEFLNIGILFFIVMNLTRRRHAFVNFENVLQSGQSIKQTHSALHMGCEGNLGNALVNVQSASFLLKSKN